MIQHVLDKIHWLGHDGIRIDTNPVIYVDPYQIEPGVEAGILLITHEHYDHCAIDDVKKVLGEETVIVTEKDSAAKLKKEIGVAVEAKINVVTQGDVINVKGISITAVPSYNVDKKFHPKSNGWLGFVVEIDGVKIYHAGDTDLIPEMADIKCDIALLPVSGTYVMTADEAVIAAQRIRPTVAIPMHYGSLVGDGGDAESFRKSLDGKIDVKILQKE